MLLAFTFSGMSQNLELLYNGATVGDTLTLHVTNLLSRNDFYVDVVNHSDRATIDVKVRKKELFIVQGTENSFCFGTACFDSEVSPVPFTIDPLDTFSYATQGDHAFHISYFPFNNLGTSYIRYTFFNTMAPDEDTVSFVAEIVADASSFIEQQALYHIRSFPNPAEGDWLKVEYDFTEMIGETSPLLLHFTNIMGQTVQMLSLSKSSDVIELQTKNLPSSLYFLTFTHKGNVIASQKIVIR